MAILFTYDFQKKCPAEKMRFHRELYGYTDYSKFGKYKYSRPGLLTKIPHLNPTQSCVIVKRNHAARLRKLFLKYDIKWDERKVTLKRDEKIE